jgi:hypothetical protein
LPYPTFHPQSETEAPGLLDRETFRELFPLESDYVEFKQGVGGRALAEAVTAFGQETEATVHQAVSARV